MQNFILEILDWSEVWSIFIPLSVLSMKGNQPAYLKPVIIYLFIALPLYLFADIIWKFKLSHHFPHWLQTNNYLYNIHSIVIVVLFSIFFINLKQSFLEKFKKIIPFFFIGFVIVNFAFFENFFEFNLLSSRLLSLAACLLLFYCLQYYFSKLQQEDDLKIKADFWVVTGLSIYITVSFFVFLFQNRLAKDLELFAVTIWKVVDIAYIVFCIFIAKAFSLSKG